MMRRGGPSEPGLCRWTAPLRHILPPCGEGGLVHLGPGLFTKFIITSQEAREASHLLTSIPLSSLSIHLLWLLCGTWSWSLPQLPGFPDIPPSPFLCFSFSWLPSGLPPCLRVPQAWHFQHRAYCSALPSLHFFPWSLKIPSTRHLSQQSDSHSGFFLALPHVVVNHWP